MSVRYVGFFAESSGYAEAARRQLLALAGTGHRVTALSVTLETDAAFELVMPSVDHREVRRLVRRADAERVRLIHTPPPHFPLFRIPSCRLIGITAWELSAIPDDWRAPLDSMDEIWVPSQFCADAFARATRRPVQVVPHPVEAAGEGPAEIPDVDPSTFLFLSTFEWSDRKNPVGLLRAFVRAFPGRRDVALFLKIGLRLQSNRKKILRTIARELGRGAFPHVYVCFDILSPRAMKRLVRRANAYVSLHRAEGFGLTMAEAMAADKPVVATGYSGNLEFMDENSAFLVDYRLTPARERLTRTGLIDPRLSWAEPRHDAAVAALRACVDSPALAARVGSTRAGPRLERAIVRTYRTSHAVASARAVYVRRVNRGPIDRSNEKP